MIKAIIFDYFGVISSDDYWKFVKADKHMAGEFQHLSEEVNTGVLDWRAFVKEVAQKLHTSIEEVTDMYASERINPVLLAYIASLHKSYKTALLTNASQDFLQPIVNAAGFNEIFDEIIISSIVGVTKPDPKIFTHTLDKLDVKAEEAIFIDDTKRHTETATSLGMAVILYQDFEQMKGQLESMLSKNAHPR